MMTNYVDIKNMTCLKMRILLKLILQFADIIGINITMRYIWDKLTKSIFDIYTKLRKTCSICPTALTPHS
jgi:hypothetical protein